MNKPEVTTTVIRTGDSDWAKATEPESVTIEPGETKSLTNDGNLSVCATTDQQEVIVSTTHLHPIERSMSRGISLDWTT